MERQFAEIVGKAATVFMKDGFHTPILFVQRHGGGWVALQMRYENDREKAAAYKALALAFHRRPAEGYIFVTEGWARAYKALDDMLGSPRPSEDPDRIEVLTVYGADREGRRRMKIWRIHRDPRGLEDMGGSDGSEALFDRLLLHLPGESKLEYGDNGLQLAE